MATKAVAGIFLSYQMQPGGDWSGDYHVMSLEDIRLHNLEDPDGPDTSQFTVFDNCIGSSTLRQSFRLQLTETDSWSAWLKNTRA